MLPIGFINFFLSKFKFFQFGQTTAIDLAKAKEANETYNFLFLDSLR
jgi:hypothetical protein